MQIKGHSCLINCSNKHPIPQIKYTTNLFGKSFSHSNILRKVPTCMSTNGALPCIGVFSSFTMSESMHRMYICLVNVTSGIRVKPHPMPKSHTFLWRKRSIMGLCRVRAAGYLTGYFILRISSKSIISAHLMQVNCPI